MSIVAILANVGQKWQEALIPFVNNYSVKLTASEVSRITKVPGRTISRILGKLVNLNLIRYVIEGKNKKYYLDLKDQRVKYLIELVESYKALKFSLEQKKIFYILEEIMSLRDIVIFGSYAKGNFTSASDVDVLVIGNDSKKIRAIARKQTKSVNLHFSTLKGFEVLLKKKNVLAIEIINNHVLFGSSFFDICWRFYKNEL